ncbi:MAG: lipocalin-like domain-containing protein [Acidobacteria bacterium]|nr:lipocalin-like domain-containing protein [Acidobacteriota bacterium]
MGNIAQQFVGTWRQVSSVHHLADGTTRSNPIYGKGGVGYLIYTDVYRMCAMVMDPDRPQWKPGVAPTEADVRAAFQGLTAYCGTYEVNAEQGIVVHHVEIDSVPSRVGTSQRRYFQFSGNRLVLRVDGPLPEGVVDYVITWERVA